MSHVFMDGGNGINLMFASILAAMRIPLCSLEQSDTTFHDIIPGKGIFPLGKIWLNVIFGKPDNFWCERLEFEVVDWPSHTTPSSGARNSQGSWQYRTMRTCYSRCQDLG